VGERHKTVYVNAKHKPSPYECYFIWSTENIFKMTNILRYAKHSKKKKKKKKIRGYNGVNVQVTREINCQGKEG